jgi:hypothetical protein
MVLHPDFSCGGEGVLRGKRSAAGEPRSKEAEEGQAEDGAGLVALCAANERRGRARRKEEMKAKLAFGAPLYLYAERARPKLGMIQLRCVDDGLSSLLRGDLGKYRFESDGAEREIWGTALFALARAKFRPSVERTEAARSALRNLASASGALVTIREAARELHGFSGSEGRVLAL